MANKMLIDATHPEETRVVVVRGNRVEEFDFESANRKQLRGNIYLAKVTRVEPSLQAAFVDYGGNRHGFLAFSEIHPDYYQIPVADRQALLEEEALSQREEDEEANGERRSRRRRHSRQPEVESRAENGETVSEPAFPDDAQEPVPPSSANAPAGAADEADDADRSATASEEIGPVPTVAPWVSEETQRTDAERAAEAATPLESELHGSAPTVAQTAGEHVGASPKEGDAERHELPVEERPVEEDPHEITTLEGGSEERVASGKQ